MSLSFEGGPLVARTGQSVGAALVDAGIVSWRTTRFDGAPRGLFCGIGVCYDCLITVDGRPNQRACIVPVAEGMRLTSGAEVGDPGDGEGYAGTDGDGRPHGGDLSG